MYTKKVRYVALVIMFAVLIVITGCGNLSVSAKADTMTDESIIQKLQTADRIIIEEKIISMNAAYEVYVDDTLLGTIEGKVLPITGDTLVLRSVNGTILASEKQIKRWGVKLNRLAEVSDDAGKITGYIGEETMDKIFSIGTFFYFYDKNKEQVGTADEVNISIPAKYKYSNTNGDLEYTVNSLIALGNKYELNKETAAPKIHVYNAIFMVCINNAIASDSKSR